MKLSYVFTIPLKTLWYGNLAHHHTKKAVKFADYPYALGYHRDLVKYYYRLAFNEEPVFGDKKK